MPARFARAWHGKMWEYIANYADGHAGVVKMCGHRHPQPRLSHYPDWRGMDVGYAGWHCATIRGDRWQLDILPAQPVATNIPCSHGAAVIPMD